MAYSNFYARFYGIFDKIKASLGAIFHYKPSWVYLSLIVFWQIAAWVQTSLIRQKLSGEILVLHYNVDFGIDRIGDPAQIYLFPLLGLGVFLLSFILLAILYKNKNFKALVMYLLGSSAIFGLFLSIALVAVYLINFR
ncbi:MAG: hypothetical protein WC467_02830 [Patescibacteria group bacterium]